jgi:hypothetical protein
MPMKSERPSPPRRLFLSKRFEFTAALPVKECVIRLKSADQMPTGCFNPTVFVSVSPETLNFHMYVETPVGKGWVIGMMQSLDRSSTRLSGKFGAGPEIMIYAIVMLLVTPLIFYAMLESETIGVVGGLSLFFMALFIAIIWYNLHWARSKLFKVFEQIVAD